MNNETETLKQQQTFAYRKQIKIIIYVEKIINRVLRHRLKLGFNYQLCLHRIYAYTYIYIYKTSIK